MKKNFALILGLLCCEFIFTSFSPSIDGRAVVAEDGVMPKGIFAKTVGYLPGDSISVTNLAKKSTVDILVIGALDPSEGIAILLTPEAADLLGMDKKKNNVVKVTKRSGQLDETVSGTAIIGDVIDEDFDDEETESVEIAENAKEAESVEIAEITESAEEEDNEYEESPFVEVAEEAVAVAEEEEKEEFEEEMYVPSESVESFEYAYEPYTEETVEEEFEETVAIPVVADSKEPIFEKIEENDDFASEKFYVASERVDEDDLSEYDFDRYENCDEDEDVFVAAVYEEIEPVSEDSVESEEGEVASRSFDEDAPPQYVRVEDVDDFDESVSSALFEEVEEDEEIAYSPEPSSEVYVVEDEISDEEYEMEEDMTENAESYDAIVLVPASPKTPEEPVGNDEEECVPSNETGLTFEDSSDETEVDEGAVIEEGIVLVPLVNEEVRAESASEENVEPHIVDDFPFDKYMVSDLKCLESGKYYVQIAIYNDNVNVRGVLDKYSENYPMVIVPTSSGNANQVMVGPLNIDEYGTVLNRFKSYGYKDAFLRKIR